MSEEVISTKQAADRLGLSQPTIRSYIREGRMRGFRVGRKLYKTYVSEVKKQMQPVTSNAEKN